MKTVKELLELLELKQINDTTFEGKSFSIGNPNVFGGQVLAQALNAAYRTVSDERSCHSFHAYFILPGDLEKPIVFKVHLVRDGGSFTTRYITANQEDKSIFVMAASFQKEESGYDFQHKMPDAPEPDSLLSWDEIYEQTKDFLPQKINSFLSKKDRLLSNLRSSTTLLNRKIYPRNKKFGSNSMRCCLIFQPVIFMRC